MIEVVVSDSCPHCVDQIDVMKRSFFDDEYEIIKVGSAKFASYDLREAVIGVPFLVVRGEDGEVSYQGAGVVDGTTLRQIFRGNVDIEQFLTASQLSYQRKDGSSAGPEEGQTDNT